LRIELSDAQSRLVTELEEKNLNEEKKKKNEEELNKKFLLQIDQLREENKLFEGHLLKRYEEEKKIYELQAKETYVVEIQKKEIENKKLVEDNKKIVENLIKEQKNILQETETTWKSRGWFKVFEEELKTLPAEKLSIWNKNLKDAKRLLNAAKKENLLCKVCCEESAVVIFMPCKHMVVCQVCSNVQNCIICRQPIIDKIVPFT